MGVVCLSILYLRCAEVEAEVRLLACGPSFNSLFEMRQVCRRNRKRGRRDAFNSLFEMLYMLTFLIHSEFDIFQFSI